MPDSVELAAVYKNKGSSKNDKLIAFNGDGVYWRTPKSFDGISYGM